jgi:hypothetical protein
MKRLDGFSGVREFRDSSDQEDRNQQQPHGDVCKFRHRQSPPPVMIKTPFRMALFG